MPAFHRVLRKAGLCLILLSAIGYAPQAMAKGAPSEEEVRQAWLNYSLPRLGDSAVAMARSITLDGCEKATGLIGYNCDIEVAVFGYPTQEHDRFFQTKDGWKMVQDIR